jgi:hypothetical protein
MEPDLPEDKQLLLDRIVSLLSSLPGMAAIALGGSYASGSAHPGSDLDIGLYYHESSPFSIDEVRRVAREVAQGGKPTGGGSFTVTGFYEWGAWVNGGAWIHTPLIKIDFLYRNIDQLRRTIDEAGRGLLQHDYDQQPAYGFYSVIYLAETQICLPLYDPQGLIAALKAQVAVYPPKMKERIILDSLWSAEFTLLHGRGFAEKGDVYNTAGCLTRAAANLTQVLFALNETYFIRDKQVMRVIAGFSLYPAGYVEQVTGILAHPGSSAEELTRAVERMQAAWQSVVALTGGLYQAKFQV